MFDLTNARRIRDSIRNHPEEWSAEVSDGKVYWITHIPTGFSIQLRGVVKYWTGQPFEKGAFSREVPRSDKWVWDRTVSQFLEGGNSKVMFEG